jgi:hypothetical protein
MRGEVGHEFGRTDSGHEVADSSGQLGLGFWPVVLVILAEGCSFGCFVFRLEFEFDVVAVAVEEQDRRAHLGDLAF